MCQISVSLGTCIHDRVSGTSEIRSIKGTYVKRLVIHLVCFIQVSGGGLRSLSGSGSKRPRPGMVVKPNLAAFGIADSDSDGAS